MYNKINLMVPTYKRIDTLKLLIDSAKDTAKNPDSLWFSFCVNQNDTSTQEFLRSYNTGESIYEDTRQPNLAMYWNLLYDKTSCPDALVSMIGDDMEFKTPGWDEVILNTINEADGKAVVYCDDNFIAHESLCVNLFTTRKVVEATKKPFMCTEFHADMIDLVWYYTAKQASILKYLPNVIIQHNHATKYPPMKWDDTQKRLQPIKGVYNQEYYRKFARAYATLCAANLIDAGIGSWDIL